LALAQHPGRVVVDLEFAVLDRQCSDADIEVLVEVDEAGHGDGGVLERQEAVDGPVDPEGVRRKAGAGADEGQVGVGSEGEEAVEAGDVGEGAQSGGVFGADCVKLLVEHVCVMAEVVMGLAGAWMEIIC